MILAHANPNNRIFFITARSYNSWWATLRWLKANGIPAQWHRTIITNTPHEKFELLISLTKRTKNVYWVDDLSYNHEFGNIMYYDDLLLKVKKTSIRYYGATTINQINQSA